MAATAPAPAEVRAAPPKLKRTIGLWMATALVFGNLGRALPRTGGPYAYARRAFGDFVGYLAVFWPATGTNVGMRWWQKRTALVVPEEEIAR